MEVTSVTPSKWREWVEFHFQALQGMYFSEYIKKDDCTLLFSDLVEDNYYNYVTGISAPTRDVAARERAAFERRGRRLGIYVTPGDNAYDSEESLAPQFKSWAKDAWMVLADPGVLSRKSATADCTVEHVSIANRSDYCDVFQKAYSGTTSDDAYGALPAYYRQSLFRSFERTLKNYKTLYVWALHQSRPVSVASMVWNERIAAVYGIGTLQEARRHGAATCLMSHLSERAKAEGVADLILQTEAGSYAEEWYKRLGFRTQFTCKYFVEA